MYTRSCAYGIPWRLDLTLGDSPLGDLTVIQHSKFLKCRVFKML